jgi:hypothetical protein
MSAQKSEQMLDYSACRLRSVPFSFLSVIPSLAFVSIGCCRENIVFLRFAAKKIFETNVAAFQR